MNIVSLVLIKTSLLFLFLLVAIFLSFYIELLASHLFSKGRYLGRTSAPLKNLLKLMLSSGTKNEFISKFIPPLNLFLVLIPAAVIPICTPYYLNGAPLHSEIFETEYGVLLFFAFASLCILAVLWSVWPSKKYLPILSVIRAAYREISCKIPLLMVALSMVLFFKTADINQIGLIQEKTSWGIVHQPLGALIFFFSLLAEIGRPPFDTAENMPELNGGYLASYSGHQSLFLMLAETINMITFSLIFVHLFLGGSQLFGGLEFLVKNFPHLQFLFESMILLFKVLILNILYTLISLLIARFRHEDIIFFGQKILLPLSFINLLVIVSGQFYKYFSTYF